MRLNTTQQTLTSIFNRLPVPAWIAIGFILFIGIPYVVLFVIPKQVIFSYAGETCVPQLTIAPSSMQQTGDSNYSVRVKNVVSVNGVQLLGSSICFSPTKVPEIGSSTVMAAPYGGIIAAHNYNITVPEAPVANAQTFINSTVPTTRALKIPLNVEDEIFAYKLKAADKTADCDHKDSNINCDIPSLGLNQGADYEVTLERHFDNKKVATLASGKVTTLLPLQQTAASIAEAQVVYDKATNIVFTYDKKLLKGEATLKKQVGEAWEEVSVKEALKDNTLTITPDAELPRETHYQLTIVHAEAQDGSAIDGPTVVHFSTSGGPKVTGVNIAPYGISQSGTIIITLDQEVANVAKIGELVSAQGIDVKVTKNGNTLRLAYANAPFCGSFTLSVKKGLESAAGVVNEKDWSYAGRTICHTIRTIGASTQGRAIQAYTFGSGSKTILYTGAIHGNEHSSRLLMNAWINELEANVGSIPAGTRIIVVPSVNPDGVAANSRYNSRTVDLNRNFNVSDWKKDVQTVGGQPLPGGGGSAPESEQETRVLVNFTREVAPHLTMSYHAAAAYAIGNGCGSSATLASKYAKLSGYRNMTGVSGAFSYEITGTYDDWICEKLGRQSVLIELATSSNAEFNRNKAAMWEMTRS